MTGGGGAGVGVLTTGDELRRLLFEGLRLSIKDSRSSMSLLRVPLASVGVSAVEDLTLIGCGVAIG